MFTLQHRAGIGWATFRDGKEWSCAEMAFDDAIDVIHIHHPSAIIDLKCECCGSRKDVDSVDIAPGTEMLMCGVCRKLPNKGASSEAEVSSSLPLNTNPIREIDHEKFLGTVRRDAYKFNMGTTGDEKLDRAACLPNAPGVLKNKPVKVMAESAPTQCDICEGTITKEYIDGIVKGAGCWGNMCPSCFKAFGIGLGLGRGQRYQQDAAGDYVKIDG